MRASEFITENKTTLNKLYNGNFPERDESFWDEVRPHEFDNELEIKVLPKHKLAIMIQSQYRVEHLDELLDLMDEDQQEILQRYMNDPNLSNKIILLSGDRIIDGNHRALAAALKGMSINYVDLADLDEQDVTEGKIINTYLWHGSRHKNEILHPRQAVDTGGAAGSNQNAIYATSDPNIAIAMGLTTSGSDTGMFPNDPQMVLFSGDIRKGKYVYLHKLPMNGPDGKPQFVQGGNSREFHSVPDVKQIKPIEIKEVPVNKYLNLIRKATKQDWALRKKYMKNEGVSEDSVNEIYKMPPTNNSSQGMTVWAYNDSLEKKSPVMYKNNNVVIFKASEDLLRYIVLQDGNPVLYIGLSKFLDGYKSGTVATEIAGRGKGLAQQAYLNASDILGVPIYSDSTQTDASRLGIWNKLIQQYPDRIVGYDQKTNKNLPLSMTDKGPTVNQNQPIYVDRNKKDSSKPLAPNQRYRTRILKLLPSKKQGVTESTSGVTPTGYTWSFEHGGEVPYKSEVEVNTFIRVRDSKGKTVLGVWADVYGDDVEIQYSEVFDKKLRGKGIYTDFLKGLAKHYNVISDQDQNNAARNIYKKLGADYNRKTEKHTLRRTK